MFNGGCGPKLVEKKLIKYRVGLTYPEFINFKDSDVQRIINETIQEEIYKMIIELGYEDDYTKEIWGNFGLKLNKKDLLSLLLDINSYSKGAAHSCKIVRALNFNLANGKTYELKDLFAINSDYIKKINEFIKDEIHGRNIPLLLQFETIDRKQDFYLGEASLTLFFQLYEYTPYAYGIPEFSMDYSKLDDIICKTGPIYQLLNKK